jgi:hypothetical protein
VNEQSTGSVATGAEQFVGATVYASEEEPLGKFKGDDDMGGKNKQPGKGTAGQDAGKRRNRAEDDDD